MTVQLIRQIKAAVSNLNPGAVREDAERPLHVGLVALDPRVYAEMEDFLAPAEITRGRRWELFEVVHRATDPGAPPSFDIEIYQENIPRPQDAFVFSPEAPQDLVRDVLARRPDLALALASRFGAFRGAVAKGVIHRIARENALFVLITALPDVAPSLAELPWAFGEFASDTAFLTVNQVRMAFLLAAASNHPVGYLEQKGQIAPIVAGAFGWRALARELVGKIPFGGGLIPKAAVAYAGTLVVGLGLERYYRIGYGYTREERGLAYRAALEQGREVARTLLDGLRPGKSAKERIRS